MLTLLLPINDHPWRHSPPLPKPQHVAELRMSDDLVQMDTGDDDVDASQTDLENRIISRMFGVGRKPTTVALSFRPPKQEKLPRLAAKEFQAAVDAAAASSGVGGGQYRGSVHVVPTGGGGVGRSALDVARSADVSSSYPTRCRRMSTSSAVGRKVGAGGSTDYAAVAGGRRRSETVHTTTAAAAVRMRRCSFSSTTGPGACASANNGKDKNGGVLMDSEETIVAIAGGKCGSCSGRGGGGEGKSRAGDRHVGFRLSEDGEIVEIRSRGGGGKGGGAGGGEAGSNQTTPSWNATGTTAGPMTVGGRMAAARRRQEERLHTVGANIKQTLLEISSLCADNPPTHESIATAVQVHGKHPQPQNQQQQQHRDLSGLFPKPRLDSLFNTHGDVQRFRKLLRETTDEDVTARRVNYCNEATTARVEAWLRCVRSARESGGLCGQTADQSIESEQDLTRQSQSGYDRGSPSDDDEKGSDS